MYKNIVMTMVMVSAMTFSSYGQLSKNEKALIKAIDNNEEKYITLLKKIVDINSGTMNFDGVQNVAKVLKKDFEDLGLTTTITSGEAYGRAGHLVASRTGGSKGSKILLIGHLDTVFEPSSPFQQHAMINDTTMKGPGVIDMKGGDVIILLALKGLKDAGLLDKLSLKVILTGDEESSGSPLSLSKKELTEAADWADIALGFENADGDPKTIVTARRGSTKWKLEVKGQPSHSSQIFTEHVGTGAIYEASRILNDFYQTLSQEKNLTFNPGIFVGGTQVTYDDNQKSGTSFGKNNVVAKDAIVAGDIRAVSINQLNMAKEKMQQIVKNNYPQTQATLTFDEEGGYPPMAATKGNELLLKIYDSISQALGYGPVTAVDPRDAGAADISFTAGRVDMAIDGLGLCGDKDHRDEEFGYINTLSQQAKRTAVLLLRLSAK